MRRLEVHLEVDLGARRRLGAADRDVRRRDRRAQLEGLLAATREGNRARPTPSCGARCGSASASCVMSVRSVRLVPPVRCVPIVRAVICVPASVPARSSGPPRRRCPRRRRRAPWRRTRCPAAAARGELRAPLAPLAHGAVVVDRLRRRPQRRFGGTYAMTATSDSDGGSEKTAEASTVSRPRRACCGNDARLDELERRRHRQRERSVVPTVAHRQARV